MTNYDKIYEIAADNYGIITREQAKKIGVIDKELSRLVSDGRLLRLGHGVYRIKHHVIGDLDPYAESVALVGPEAYLFGESVLALLSLCHTNPTKMYVATPKRVRKKLPLGLSVVKRAKDDIVFYEGIPSQSVDGAIRSSIGRIMPERLISASKEAADKGYIDKDTFDQLITELESP